MASDIANVDQAALLQLYGLSTLNPERWEDGNDQEHVPIGVEAHGPIDDPLGLSSRLVVPRDVDIQDLQSILLTSKTFSPAAFISHHHPDASFQDLQRGISYLRTNVDAQGAEVKLLVEREFGRFVSVKGSNDAVHRDLRVELLGEASDHGTRETREIIKITSHKAETIFLPLLSNALKAQKLKSTASVFERSKFLFGLPRNLRMYIRAGKFEAALRDYHKGLYLLETRPNQLLPVANSTAESNTAIPETQSQVRKEQQKRVFDKIWLEVEKIMGEMRNGLERGLKEGAESVEEVEKNIEILLELNPKEDPVWVYLDSAYHTLTEKLKHVYSIQLQHFQAVRDKYESRPMDDTASALNLKRCIERLTRLGGDSTISKSAGSEEWEAMVHLITRLSSVLVNSLPDFWRIAKGHMEGKYRKRDQSSSTTSSRRPSTQSRNMTIEIIKLYISLLSQFFTLSDVSIASQNPSPPASFAPTASNSVTACHFVSKLLTEILETMGEIEGIGGHLEGERAGSQQEVKGLIKGFVESCRWRFEEVICATWSKDARSFFRLEGWQLNPADRTTTTYLDHIAALQKHNSTIAWQVAGGSSESGDSKAAVPTIFVTKIKNSFFDSLYYLLDGLVHLAFSGSDPLNVDDRVAGRNDADYNDKDTRVLLTISNLQSLKKTLLPSFMTKFERMYKISTAADRGTLDEVVEQLDKILFDDFIKRRAEALLEIAEQGLVRDGLHWAEGENPTEVRPYLLKTLLYLVHVHSQVNAIAPDLVTRVTEALFVEVAAILLSCLQQFPKLGMGGMLRATLEIEFLHQTLLQYVTEPVSVMLSDIYNVISQAYSRDASEETLQREMDNLKKVLIDCRRATGVEFVCFKVNKL